MTDIIAASDFCKNLPRLPTRQRLLLLMSSKFRLASKFHAAGFGSAVVGLLGAFGAVTAGLIMTHRRVLGGGYEKTHHLFVWPALISCVLFVGWRLLKSGRIANHRLGIYFAGMGIASVLMLGAGYSGGWTLDCGSVGHDDQRSSRLGPSLATLAF